MLKPMKHLWSLTLLLLISILSAGARADITVYAAASLTDALSEISSAWQAEYPKAGVVKTSFAASSTLARQIEAGAPADLFISADTQWMDYLQQRKLINEASRRDLLGNSLVLIAPTTAKALPIRLEKGADLAAAFKGRLCTGDPAHVPVGRYARQALENLGMWDTLARRIVAADNVRAALAFVARGECQLGIVYATDTRISDRVTVLARFPADSHDPVVYPVALLNDVSTTAHDFHRHLDSTSARTVFERYGFDVLP